MYVLLAYFKGKLWNPRPKAKEKGSRVKVIELNKAANKTKRPAERKLCHSNEKHLF